MRRELTSGVKIDSCHGATFNLRATFPILIETPSIPPRSNVILHILHFKFFNSPGYCANLMIDSERLRASTTDGGWLRVYRVGQRDEKVKMKSKYQHPDDVDCSPLRRSWVCCTERLDSIWAVVREGDC